MVDGLVGFAASFEPMPSLAFTSSLVASASFAFSAALSFFIFCCASHSALTRAISSALSPGFFAAASGLGSSIREAKPRSLK